MEESKVQRTVSERLAETKMGRRRLIETLGLAGGALAASALLPSKWVKPVASQSATPTTDETSPVLGTGDLQVTVTWDTDGTDIDTWVQEPSGFWVYWGDEEGPTATLDVDDTDGFGPENVFVPAGGAAAGVYKVYVGYYWDDEIEEEEAAGAAREYQARPTDVTIRITTFDGAPQMQQATFHRLLTMADGTCTLFAVANVTFPAGSIVEQTGTMENPEWGDECDLGVQGGRPSRKG
jgi:hypothetical protein